MRYPRRRPRLAELQKRLARLRETTTWLDGQAGMGREMRLTLARWGSPTWRPCEDLCWRRWIEREGDEEARMLLVAIDELLDELLAKRVGEGEGTT